MPILLTEVQVGIIDLESESLRREIYAIHNYHWDGILSHLNLVRRHWVDGRKSNREILVRGAVILCCTLFVWVAAGAIFRGFVLEHFNIIR